MNKNDIKTAKTFDELLDKKYEKMGTPQWDEFEEKAAKFIISEALKSSRLEANLTQEKLAEKVGTKKSYISRIENGNCDVQLSTLFKIFEKGLGKEVRILIVYRIFKNYSHPIIINPRTTADFNFNFNQLPLSPLFNALAAYTSLYTHLMA